MKKIKFTIQFLKNLPLGTDKFSDTDIKYLELWVTATQKSFYFCRRFEYKKYQFKIGSYPDITLEEARNKVLEYNGKLANYGSLEAPAARMTPTLSDIWNAYREHLKSPGKADSAFLGFFRSLLKNKITSITKSEVQRLHERGKEYPVQSNRAVQLLRTAINYAIKQKIYNGENPIENFDFYPETARRRFLQQAEAPTVIETINGLRAKALYTVQCDAILMMLYTGQRKSNVLSMQFSDITNGVWIIKSEDAKNAEETVVQLNAYALEIVERRRVVAKNEYLFPARDRDSARQHISDVSKTWRRICALAGADDLHIHDLRRSLASWMLINGTPIAVVSRMLGHKSIAVTERVYAHLLPSVVSDASAAAISAMQSGRIGGQK